MNSGWSTRVGRFFGIDVFIHATFWLLVGFIALTAFLRTREIGDAVEGVAFILAIFACVVAHEYGHALTARRYGVKTRDITLYPIGGLARLERIPENPREELWVALAGPAVNVVIAAVLGIYVALTSSLGSFEALPALVGTSGSFAQRLLVANLIIVGFNLLPAFPMDGGRVLRAVLAMRLPYQKATQIAANVGQGMALLFGLLGLLSGNFLLLFVALFVWIGAGQEAQATQTRNALHGVPIGSVMMTEFRTLSPQNSLGEVIGEILRGAQQDFPVLDERGELAGLLTRADFVKALEERGQSASVGEVMRRDFCAFEAAQMLERVMPQLADGDCRSAPVTREGRLVGLFTGENLAEYLMIQSALSSRDGGVGPSGGTDGGALADGATGRVRVMP